MNIISFIIIGLIAGWIASLTMGGRGFGLIGDAIIGIIGAFIGGFALDIMGVAWMGLTGAILISILGAIILLAISGLIKKA